MRKSFISALVMAASLLSVGVVDAPAAITLGAASTIRVDALDAGVNALFNTNNVTSLPYTTVDTITAGASVSTATPH